MSTLLIGVCAAFTGLSPPASAFQFGPVLTGGPRLTRVAVSPRNPDAIVFTYRNHHSFDPGSTMLARTADGGVTADVMAVKGGLFGDQDVEDIAFSANGVLYVNTRDSLYRSVDQGATLTEIWSVPGVGDQILDVSLAPDDPSEVWIGGDFQNSLGGSAVRSFDGGSTWVDVPPIASASQPPTRFILFDRAAPERVMIHTGSRFYRSEDSGQSFPIVGGLYVALTYAITLPQNTEVLLHRGRLLVFNGLEVEESVDDGVTFAVLNPGASAWSPVIQNPLYPDRLVFFTSDGVRWTSDDGGVTWLQVALGRYDMIAWSRAAFIPSVGTAATDDVLAVASEVGLYRLGMNHSRGLGVAIPGRRSISYYARYRALEFDRRNKDRWIMGPYFPFLSEDRGQTWRGLPYPESWLPAARFDADGNVIVFDIEGVGGHLILDSSGAVMERGVSPGSRRVVMAPSPTSPSTLVASEDFNVRLSVDSGNTWTLIGSHTCGATGCFFADIRFLGVRTTVQGMDIVRAGLAFHLVGEDQTIYWSEDQGATWSLVPAHGPVASITVNNTFPEVTYASDSRGASQLLRSNDRGLNWSPVGTAGHHGAMARGNLDPELLVRSRLSGGDVHLQYATPIDLELSHDGGLSWISIGAADGVVERPFLAPDDSYVVAGGRLMELTQDLGTNECVANVNATGFAARMSAVGSSSAQAEDVTLVATDLPPSTFGIFIGSKDADFVPNPGGTLGNLCLGGTIGRIQVAALVASPTGVMSHRLDTTSIPQAGPLVAIGGGETWRFQAWFRDVGGANFTDAVAVTFAP